MTASVSRHRALDGPRIRTRCGGSVDEERQYMDPNRKRPKPASKGWRAQSIGVFRHLTRPGSAARTEGLMPGYAACAYRIAMAAGRVAGMAKKRWRDADEARTDLKEIRRLRSRIDDAFADIERALSDKVAGRTGVRDVAASEDVYETNGLVGIIGLSLMEESAELAEHIHAVATGHSSMDERRERIGDEAADLRTWLHLADTMLDIESMTATQRKWGRFMATMPDEVVESLMPKLLTKEQVNAAYAAVGSRREGRKIA